MWIGLQKLLFRTEVLLNLAEAWLGINRSLSCDFTADGAVMIP